MDFEAGTAAAAAAPPATMASSTVSADDTRPQGVCAVFASLGDPKHNIRDAHGL